MTEQEKKAKAAAADYVSKLFKGEADYSDGIALIDYLEELCLQSSGSSG
ncbi:hypothetical protein LCGC14_0145240 [marine sediment metagenome]|uniref:Uncharacterized protein n=1 Tax=marine sediment metagenome TaxID=412755 RepID=A0A0F9UZR3_9ZZZZ